MTLARLERVETRDRARPAGTEGVWRPPPLAAERFTLRMRSSVPCAARRRRGCSRQYAPRPRARRRLTFSGFSGRRSLPPRAPRRGRDGGRGRVFALFGVRADPPCLRARIPLLLILLNFDRAPERRLDRIPDSLWSPDNSSRIPTLIRTLFPRSCSSATALDTRRCQISHVAMSYKREALAPPLLGLQHCITQWVGGLALFYIPHRAHEAGYTRARHMKMARS